MKLNTIALIYKTNLTAASFVDHEQRIQALERKLPLRPVRVGGEALTSQGPKPSPRSAS
jgi:hypothetical protein